MELSKKVMSVGLALDNKKAEDISVIDISKNSSIADNFILATATSTTHAKTLSDAVGEAVEVFGEKVFAVDGRGQADWISLDLGDVIVHIFTKEVRMHYSIEKMWADSKNHKKFSDIKKQAEKKSKTVDLKKVTEKTVDDKKKKVDSKKDKEPKPAPKKQVKKTDVVAKVAKDVKKDDKSVKKTANNSKTASKK